MLIAAPVQIAEVPRESTQEAQLFQAKIGAGQMSRALTRIGCFDQGFQDIQGCALHPVGQQEFLASRKPFQNRHQPQGEAIVGFESGPDLARAVPGPRLGGRVCVCL